MTVYFQSVSVQDTVDLLLCVHPPLDLTMNISSPLSRTCVVEYYCSGENLVKQHVKGVDSSIFNESISIWNCASFSIGGKKLR